jgi:hypothetical protein
MKINNQLIMTKMNLMHKKNTKYKFRMINKIIRLSVKVSKYTQH